MLIEPSSARGFGRQQVPLMVDGVRIYLPADNRLDFGRFLTTHSRTASMPALLALTASLKIAVARARLS
jgi:hypothetical protein